MAIFIKNKYNVSDPAYYDPFIAEQKSRVRQNPNDAEAWLEMGRIHETRINMINYLTRRNFALRNFLPMFVILTSVLILVFTLSGSMFHLLSWQRVGLLFLLLIIAIVISIYMVSLRYPPSGNRYFRKVVALDPACGEAYMYLGLIALRRYQKRKACRLLERAIRLDVKSNKIERELKSIYEKEFMSFFNKRAEREIRHQEIINRQLEQIRDLQSKVCSLEELTESLSGRVNQARWEANQKAKQLTRQMTDRIAGIRKEYESLIGDIRKSSESHEEKKELAERHLVKLTTEVMESRAKLEEQSLDEAGRTVKDTMGSHLWQALLEQTRTYLATAEYIFNLLKKNEEKPDYSLVGMELCKALEIEINRAFVRPFLMHLNSNRKEFLKINRIGESKGKPLYFSHLARVVDRQNHPDITSLTLGQYHFALKHTLKGEYALREYGVFLDQIYSSSKITVGTTFLKNLETIIKRYRNTIAHHSPMNRKQCDHLRELIFGGHHALLKTCCEIARMQNMLS